MEATSRRTSRLAGFDLLFSAKAHDLVVATHGRGAFILDDISPLENMPPAEAAFHLFPVTTTTRWHTSRGGGYSLGAFTAPIQAERCGDLYYVHVNRTPEQDPRPIHISVTDSEGHVIRRIDSRPHAGINRVVWPLNFEGPTPLDFTVAAEGGSSEEGGGGGRGGGAPPVPPGTYRIDAQDTATQQTQSQTFKVEADPRMKANAAGFAAQTKASIDARSALSDLNVLVNHMEAIRAQLVALGLHKKDELGTRATSLVVKVETMEDPLYNRDAPRDSKAFLHSLSRVQDRLLRVNGQISSSYGEAPSQLTLDGWRNWTAEIKKSAASSTNSWRRRERRSINLPRSRACRRWRWESRRGNSEAASYAILLIGVQESPHSVRRAGTVILRHVDADHASLPSSQPALTFVKSHRGTIYS